MQIRFTDDNWKKFTWFGGHKTTTWRTRKRASGAYERVKGSFFKPTQTGERLQLTYIRSARFDELTERDAYDDGFESLSEFQTELKRLNPKITNDTILHCYLAEVL